MAIAKISCASQLSKVSVGSEIDGYAGVSREQPGVHVQKPRQSLISNMDREGAAESHPG